MDHIEGEENESGASAEVSCWHQISRAGHANGGRIRLRDVLDPSERRFVRGLPLPFRLALLAMLYLQVITCVPASLG